MPTPSRTSHVWAGGLTAWREECSAFLHKSRVHPTGRSRFCNSTMPLTQVRRRSIDTVHEVGALQTVYVLSVTIAGY